MGDMVIVMLGVKNGRVWTAKEEDEARRVTMENYPNCNWLEKEIRKRGARKEDVLSGEKKKSSKNGIFSAKMATPAKKLFEIAALAGILLAGCGGGNGGGADSDSSGVAYQMITGKVVSVHDGDTITILDNQNVQYKIRLDCIDAPEIGQDFGNVAKQALSGLIGEKTVTILYQETDKYGRIIGKIDTGNIDANLKMVQGGMAWVYRKYCTDCEYYDAEKNARSAIRGIWSQPNPVPPWEYRKDPINSKIYDWSNLYNDDCPAISTSMGSGGSVDKSNTSCGSKRFCTQMSSCSEAYFYYNECGIRRLDGDNDGVPCESLCR